jgi:HAD superfamily hydrolase (TIGR01548 family)
VTAPVRVSPEAAALLPRVDAIIFDIDGVLLDVSRSIRTVNCLSVPAYLRTLPGWTAPDDLLTSEDIERFKTAGGFNDDWDLTYAAVLLYLWKAAHYGSHDASRLHTLSPTIAEYTDAVSARGGWLRSAEAFLRERATPAEWEATLAGYDEARIRRLFQELWAGDHCRRLYGFEPAYYSAPGWIRLDRPLLDLSLVPANKTLAVLTGRTYSEAEFAVEMLGLAGRIPLPVHGMTKDDGNAKPDPSGLARLVVRLGCRTAVYIGDTVDDLRTVLNFRALPAASGVTVLSAQVLTGTVGPQAASLFAGADIVAPDVNDVLRLLG